MAKVKRSLIKTFLNTNTVLSPTWSLISAGVPSGTINMNPSVTTETYLADDTATISVDSYAPTFAVEASAFAGDAAYEWIDSARQGREVLDDAETEVVNVWLYKTGGLGTYYAEKQTVTIQCDSFGGEGGKPAQIGYTINYIGDAVQGGFNPTTLAFVALPVTAILTTMVIGTVTLTPLFATDKSWLWYAGSVAIGVTTVQMNSTLVGATIVQYDEAAEVAQGANASLAVGVNHLSIDVTVGSENVIYYIDITRAAS